MPIQDCYRNGEKGARWGTRGKCYLPSEEGSMAAARKKALAQGIASGDIQVNNQIIYQIQVT